MARRCIECGRIISGSVVEHYRNAHIGSLLRNGEDKIRKIPDAFAPQTGTVRAREAAAVEAKRKMVEHKQAVNTASNIDPQQRQRMRMIAAMIDSGCETQTYRGGTSFQCDMCLQKRTSGKRLLSYMTRYTVCYACYNDVKRANPGKRGNHHVFINTPM